MGKMYDIWLESYVYAFIRSIYRFLSLSFKTSAIVRFFNRDSRLEALYSKSFFAAFFRMLLDLFHRLFRWIWGILSALSRGSVTVAYGRKYLTGSFIFSYETLLGGFVLLMYMVPHDYWSNTYALLGAAALLMAYLFLAGAGLRRPYYIHQMGLPVLFFAVACVMGVLGAFDRGDAFRVFLFYVTALLMYYVISGDLVTEKRMMRFLLFIYAAVVFTSVYAVVQRFMGVEVSSSLTDLSVNKGVPGRVYSTLDNPNNYAEFLVMMTPLAAVFVMNYRGSAFMKFAFTAGMVFPFVALLMTYSRSGWISMVLSCLVFVYFANKRLIPALLLLFVAAIPFLPESVMIRIASLFNSSDSSNLYRIYIWSGALGIASDFGLSGIGLGPESYAMIYQDYAHPLAKIGAPHSHMVYLELVIELGVLGFVSFMWFMLRLWKDSARSLSASKSKTFKLVLCACIAGLIGISFTFCVEYVWYYPRTFFAYFILAGVASAAVRMTADNTFTGLSLQEDGEGNEN